MKLLMRIKIGSRLLLSFALIIIMFFGVVTVALYNYNKNVALNRSLLNDYIKNFNKLDDINITTGLLFLSYRNYYLEYPNQEKMQVRLKDINERTTTIINTLEEYLAFLEEKNDDSEDIQLVRNALDEIYNKVVPFSEKLISLVQSEKMDEVLGLIVSQELRDLRSSVQGAVSNVFVNRVDKAVEISEKDLNGASYTIAALIFLMVLTMIFAIVLSIAILKSIKKPLESVLLNSGKAASGDFNIQWNITSDEIGEVARANKQVTDTFKQLLDDINNMITRYFKGEVNIDIDTSKYSGEYAELAKNINLLYKAQINAINDVLSCLHSFAKGDFKADITKYKGEQQTINVSVDEVRDIFEGLHKEIQRLIDSSIQGDLTVKADSRRFMGEWKEIVDGLDELLLAVTTPFNEIMGVIMKMAQGDFSGRITGDYQGSFDEIKTVINNMVIVVGSYIKELSEAFTTMSDKNLDIEIKREYVGEFTTLKDATNSIVDSFNDVLSGIMSSTENFAAGARQIAEGNQVLALGVNEQTISITKTREILNDISAKTLSNVDSTEEANRLSTEAAKSAKLGNGSMRDMLDAMEKINEATNNISKVIKTIDDIAMQTNLLALNASIEAAHAGTFGKGFGVVAENVRNLASRSQEAAKDTAELLISSNESVEKGTKLANVTAELFLDVSEKIEYTSDIINNVTSELKNQSSNIEKVNADIAQISEVTHSNSSTCEEQAAASEELSSQADVLKELATRFTVKAKYRNYM